MAALLHYLFTAVFFWMLSEGIMLYLMLVVVFSQISKKWWIFFIIGWGKFYFVELCDVYTRYNYGPLTTINTETLKCLLPFDL